MQAGSKSASSGLAADVGQVSDDTKKTVLDIAMDQLHKIADKIGLSDELLTILRTPEKSSEVMPEIYRDDGVRRYKGLFIRVSNSTAIGISKGGMRYTIHIKRADAEGLAFLMTIKCAGMALPMGGGKGEAQVDLEELNPNEIARITKEGIWQLMDQYQALGDDIDVPAPDQKTGKTIMAYMEEAYLAWKLLRGGGLKNKQAERLLLADPEVRKALEYYKDDDIRIRKKFGEGGEEVADTLTPILHAAIRLHNQGHIIQELATFTDKPLDRGGIEGREEATGLGGYYAECAALEHYSQEGIRPFVRNSGVDGYWHVQRGFGNVGLEYARECYKNGGSFAGIQIFGSGIKFIGPRTGKGVDVEALIKYIEGERQKIYKEELAKALVSNPHMTEQERGDLRELIQKRDVDLRGYQQEGVVAIDIEGGGDIIDIEADILVEAATQCTINGRNAHRVKQRMLIELGNATTTRRADEILAEKGVIIIPDVLANAGGVTVSMYEIKQNITGQKWPVELTYARLEERIKHAMDVMFKIKSDYSSYHFSNRDAYWLLSLKRVLSAMEARMWKEQDPRLKTLAAYRRTILNSIYTPPQTNEQLQFLAASSPMQLQDAIDREESERILRLSSILDRMMLRFNTSSSDGKYAKVCLVGGPTGYKTQVADSIILKLHQIHGLRAVYFDLDIEGNAGKLTQLLRGERVEGVRRLDKTTRTIVTVTMQIDPKEEIVVAEGSFAIANNIIDMLPNEVSNFPIAVDICPFMNIRLSERQNMMLANDDYTILRELLMSALQRPEQLDPYDALVKAIEHRKVAISSIYSTFRNRAAIIYNTYDPFELLFSRQFALPFLALANGRAHAIISRESDGPDDRSMAESVHIISQRLIDILKKMPSVSNHLLEIAPTSGVRQILPDSIYNVRAFPRAPVVSEAAPVKHSTEAAITTAA
ncbi:MAG: Glu/Leu/Phe/Val dehydrogenase [Candidatus Omnitrophica bacterium]|nr:Glu/Leu/Phe/Val dehydrogenase [Candidatus Omnitrophota bacterium]